MGQENPPTPRQVGDRPELLVAITGASGFLCSRCRRQVFPAQSRLKLYQTQSHPDPFLIRLVNATL